MEQAIQPMVEYRAANLQQKMGPSADQRIGWRSPIL
jgi:hypothetical protein